MSNYLPLDVTFIKGNGCYLTDDKGDQYLDALCGVGVTGLGHSHPESLRQFNLKLNSYFTQATGIT
jgi:acetylornithine/succinyldiaminopimelate/putrescine aminotransferase